SYVFGGHSFSLGPGPEGDLNLATRYDPVANTWTPLTPMPDNQALMSSAVYYPPTNSIYVFGGTHRDPANLPPPTNNVWIYNISTDTWSAGPPLPDVRAFMASGYDPDNGKIYLAGGYNLATVDSNQTTTWEFDPVAGTYTEKAPMLHGLGGTAYGIIDGKLYVAGCRDIASPNYDPLFAYDIATDTWTQGPSMPQGENVPGSAVAGGKLWLFGFGTPFNPNSPLGRSLDAFDLAPTAGATTLSYDPATQSWSSGPDL